MTRMISDESRYKKSRSSCLLRSCGAQHRAYSECIADQLINRVLILNRMSLKLEFKCRQQQVLKSRLDGH